MSFSTSNKLSGSKPPISVSRVEVMSVVSYNASTHTYRLRPSIGTPIEARFISPTPTSEQGAGFFVSPKSDTQCVVLSTGKIHSGVTFWENHFILGYTTHLNTSSGQGGIMDNIQLEIGDASWFATAHTFIRQAASGVITFFANNWNQIRLHQVSQTFQGIFRHIDWRLRGGKVLWKTQPNEETNLHIEVHDKYEPNIESDVAGNGAAVNYANKVVVDAGILSAGNVLDIETRQDTTGDNVANEFTKLRIGRPDNGALVEKTYTTSEGTQEILLKSLVDSNNAEIKSYVHGENSASRVVTLDTKAGNEETVTFDNETVTESTGRGLTNKPLIKSQALDKNSNVVLQEVLIDDSTMYKIDINNGKASINVDKDGNITLLSATGNIYHGGTGKEQNLLTKTFAIQNYAMHTHISASPGSPTTIPTQPLVFLPSDSSNNISTITTKAE